MTGFDAITLDWQAQLKLLIRRVALRPIALVTRSGSPEPSAGPIV
jgi:hypothetical protein